MKRIYLDHSASTPILPEVQDLMSDLSKNLYGNPSSIHREGVMAKNLLEEARKSLALLLNASSSQFFFTSGATESNNIFLQSEIRSEKYSHIVTTQIEHPSVLNTINNLAKELKIKIDFLELDSYGRINISELQKILNTNKNSLVSLMYVNNELGTVHPITEIASLCTESNAVFHSDTVQALGLLDINVNELKIDCIIGSAHKFNGPKGVGFIYLKDPSSVKPLIFGGSQERNFRAGTENLVGIVGMVKALELAISQKEERLKKLHLLRDKLIAGLNSLPYPIEFNSPDTLCSPKILNVYLKEGKSTDWLLMNLDIEGISVSGGSACSSGTEKTSHVIEIIRKGFLGRSVRFSLSHLNTLEEIDSTISVFKKLLLV